ncbi:MAG: hypothetical protein ACYDB3_06120 [Acidimicrobiales bacterium]
MVLIERAIGHVVKVIRHADDSGGLIGDLARELLDLHARTCGASVADPLKLARWMVRFGFEDQDFFVADPVRYAGTLGERGLAAYRREVRRRRDAGDSSFAVRYAEERIAVLDGDIKRIIRLLGGASPRRISSSVSPRQWSSWAETTTSAAGRFGGSGKRPGGRWPSCTTSRLPCTPGGAPTTNDSASGASSTTGCRRRQPTTSCDRPRSPTRGPRSVRQLGRFSLRATGEHSWMSSSPTGNPTPPGGCS